MKFTKQYPNLIELLQDGYDAVTTGYGSNEDDLFHRAVEQMGKADFRIAAERGKRYICRPTKDINLVEISRGNSYV